MFKEKAPSILQAIVFFSCMCLDQSRASENICWIITLGYSLVLAGEYSVK